MQNDLDSDRVEKLVEQTPVSRREAESYLLSERGFSNREIAKILSQGGDEDESISHGTVGSAVRRARRRIREAARLMELLDDPSVSPVELTLDADPVDSDHAGLDWSSWLPLDDKAAIDGAPASAGVIRIRHYRTPELVYVGHSSDVAQRVGDIYKEVHQREAPDKAPVSAAPCLVEIGEEDGYAFEISWATPEAASIPRHRRGTKAALIALHHQSTGRVPTCSGGRMPGDTDSDLPPLPWDKYEDPTATDWMGLDWSAERPITNRLNYVSEVPEGVVYRISTPGGDLDYIGKTTAPSDRFRHHDQRLSGDYRISWTDGGIPPDHPERGTQLRLLEMLLVGWYYLAADRLPSSLNSV